MCRPPTTPGQLLALLPHQPALALRSGCRGRCPRCVYVGGSSPPQPSRSVCPSPTGEAVASRTLRRGAPDRRGAPHRPGTTGAAADGRAGVGGLHTSEDVGERVGPRTRPSKDGPCWCELSKGPMTGALTSGLMSPDIRKVVDPWPRFVALLARYPLPVPRIRVRIWGASP